jgi:eukaryotic-like serine/threonine-protein kinase
MLHAYRLFVPRWTEIMHHPKPSAEELFAEALEVPPERRSAFLDQACRDTPELRPLVDQLLAEHKRAGKFMLHPAAPTTLNPSLNAGRFHAGQLIAERFAIVRFIARGGMGEVYEARDQFLQDTRVAVKIIRPEVAADPVAAARFEQEVLLARKVVHPNLCPIYEIFRCDQPPPAFLFLTMRLLQGETLFARCERSKKLEPGEAMTICKQLLAGVAALHAGGVIHRDLKPNNVMLEAGQSGLHVAIMDFGLARENEAANTLFGPGVIAGTPGYLAPELLSGARPTKATDLYALGVVLHEVLTGERPPAGPAPSPALRSAPVAAPWKQAVEGFLSIEPETRTEAFEQLLRVETGVSGPSMSASRRIVWYVAAAILVLAVVLLLFKPSAPLSGRVESTQITFSNDDKLSPLLTDGLRLYFQSHNKPSEMAAGGGLIAPIPGLSPGMYLVDTSADGSKILVWTANLDHEDFGGWLSVGSTLGGGLRRIGTHLSTPSARWSRDGKSIYFSVDHQIYVMDEDGGNVRSLWKPPAEPGEFSASPDGKELSVTLYSPYPRLWRVNSDGQNAQPLPMDEPPGADSRQGFWTPDGQHFLFLSSRDGRGNLYELVTPPWYQFWRKPQPVRITANQLNILDAAPARDSKGLFMLGRLEAGAMQVLDPRSNKLVPFLGGLPALQFVVSPDRQWMAYTEYPSGHLWKSRLDGSEAVQLTTSKAYMLQWSPDSKRIAYSDWNKIYIISADGGTPEKVMPTGSFEVMPTWFPDGKSIAFNLFDQVNEPDGMYMVDLATRAVTPMPGAKGLYVAFWSPDGRYFVAAGREPLRMMLYTAATRQWRELHRLDAPWGFDVWAPDSRSIFISQTETNAGLYRLSVPDGAYKRIADLPDVLPGNDALLSVTADGQPAIMSHSGAAQVYAMRWK